jgi:large subunit ribosomal protein L3
MVEFPVTPDAMLPAGYRFSVRHFVPGQFLDITGTSIGKGFQGGMKKWGFAGNMASHGVSGQCRAWSSRKEWCTEPAAWGPLEHTVSDSNMSLLV